MPGSRLAFGVAEADDPVSRWERQGKFISLPDKINELLK